MGKLQTKLILVVALSLFVLFTTVQGGITDREPREYKEYNVPDQQPRKRPFCNAFTGCGRKRSAPVAAEIHEEDTISSLVDLNSEPAVEDLMRQIMAEAKLYENLQEANRELYFQKNGRHHTHLPTAFSTQ